MLQMAIDPKTRSKNQTVSGLFGFKRLELIFELAITRVSKSPEESNVELLSKALIKPLAPVIKICIRMNFAQ